MSQTSSTPGRVQSDDSRQHRSLLEEIQRLKKALEKAQDKQKLFEECWERERAENRTLKIDNEELRSSSHGTSNDQISIQHWQGRTREAERRAEQAERELSRIQGSFPEFNNAWRAMGQAFANVSHKVSDDSDDAIFLPGDEVEINYQNQDLDPAGQGEREAHPSRFGFDQDIVMTDDDITPVSDQPSMRRSSRGSQDIARQLAYDPKPISHLGSDFEHGSSLRRSSPSGVPGLKSPFEPSIRGLEGPPLERPAPPPPSSKCSQPLPPAVPTYSRQPLAQQPSLAETIIPTDRHAASSHVAGGRTDVTNQPEYHAAMQEELPAVGETSRLMEGDSLEIPEGPSQIPGIPTASTAPETPMPFTPTPRIYRAPLDWQGWTRKRPTLEEFLADMSDDEPEEQKPMPEPRVMKAVAAGKQPERPSPAKEASSATGGEPPKPTSTKSYAGATVAPPPKVKVGSGPVQTG